MKEPLASPNLSDAETTGKCYIDPDSTQAFIEALIKLKEETNAETPCTALQYEADQ